MDDEYFGDSSYYDEIVEQASKEAVANFTFDRLRAVYDKEPAIAEKAIGALAEARLLLQTPHYTAAFIHAAITSEVMLKGIILKPILQGFVHSDSIAPFIVALAFPSNSIGFERISSLLDKIFKDVSNFNLMAYKRRDGVRILWEEICDVQKRRNPIMHRAEIATKADAEYAIAVAAAVTEELFPVFAKSLGYHLHDGFRLCGDQYCLQHPEHGERNRIIAAFEKK